MKGRYCPNTGMTNINNYLCKQGYWCEEGLSVSTPTAIYDTATGLVLIGDVCSEGKFCSGNLIHQQDCPDGFYSDTTGLAICTTCPEG